MGTPSLSVFSIVGLGTVLAACGGPDRPSSTTSAVLRDTAFVGVNVLSMAEDEVGAVSDQTVLVSGGVIARVGNRDQVSVPETFTVVEGAGKYLMPGLADMHVHLEYFDDPRVLDLFLANGVTTVRNMDGRPYILEWRDRIARREWPGPRIHTAGPILDGDPPLRDDNLAIASAGDARRAVRDQRAAGYDFIKVYTNLSAEAYAVVLETARENGLPVAGHVPRGVDVEDALISGIRSIEHVAELGDLVEAEDSPFRNGWHWSKLYLGMPVDTTSFARAAGLVADSQVWIVPTMVQADRAIAPRAAIDAWLAEPELAYVGARRRRIWQSLVGRSLDRMDSEDWALVEAGRANRLRFVSSLHDAGAALLLGTDTPNPFVVPGFSIHDELANFEAAGIDRGRILALATREAAVFLETDSEVGTVEVGKVADLILLDDSPLESLDVLRRPVGVMVGGAWLPSETLADALDSIRSRGGL
ncbi:MAG: amidohydrolase family protein [Acidobacteria bacterium]|nr:amidohydrolase family protein [Acidobacteriota bacterium]